jgi:hypothetical protein
MDTVETVIKPLTCAKCGKVVPVRVVATAESHRWACALCKTNQVTADSDAGAPLGGSQQQLDAPAGA